jgi:hypothetical protein
MILDDFIPSYEFSEHHAVVVEADIGACRVAVRTWRPQDSLLWRWLLRVRGLGRPAGTLREWAESNGFLLLGETRDEIVFGQIGRFWSIDERGALVSPRTVEEFQAFSIRGFAVAAMDVRLNELADGGTLLSTETRVHTLGMPAQRTFQLYWLLIRPFSGLLRRAMLDGMKSVAQQANRLQPQAKEN